MFSEKKYMEAGYAEVFKVLILVLVEYVLRVINGKQYERNKV